jgi:hypothetical protein
MPSRKGETADLIKLTAFIMLILINKKSFYILILQKPISRQTFFYLSGNKKKEV